ncbi:major facilitator superfamily domain-containing protein 6 [Leptinotarsa decemlineata]|uniref:major facilitator superfamily domain-containing protein 6 n=1 Tax=Leptinotarsa decemlineata TaxID=7539 RepID=UPI000C255B88|nr:uncharacterized protein LOC111514231 [Leptinotarsa decemlineata]
MGEDTSTDMETNTSKAKSFFGINKNLILLKLTLFFLYGATSSLVPYLTIHMQSIGISMEQVALIYLALPFTTFISQPLTGLLADKFGRYKPLVIGLFLLTAVLHNVLLFFPQQETPGTVPAGYIIRHPKKTYVEVWWSPCTSRECPAEEELDIVLDMCVDHCLLKNAKHKNRKDKKVVPVDLGDADDLPLRIVKKKGNDTATAFTLDMHPNLGNPIEQFGIELESAEDDADITSFNKRFRAGILKKNGVDIKELENKDLRCGGVIDLDMNTKKLLSNATSDCIIQKCQFRSGGPEVCPPDFKEIDTRTFWLYFLVRFLGTVVQLGAVIIMDPVALAMIEKHGGDFGKERLFSNLGMAIFSPITGALIDFASAELGYTDYSAAFYTFDILLLLASITLFFMPLEAKIPADNVFGDLFNIFKMPAIVLFIMFLFILGNIWGFIESYLFFYLRDLGAPNSLLGITVTVGTLSSLPFLYGAEAITRKIGHVNVIIIAFFAHAARLVGYSFIESAWWCFPFEAMESLSVHLMWVAAATYCAVLAPKGLLATLIGVCGMAHYSIGRGSGSFVGGHIIAKFGIQLAFRLVGVIAVCAGLLYAFLQYALLRNVTKIEDDDDTSSEESLRFTEPEPKFKDQGTMVSMERLSLVVEYNPSGSITSLGRRHSVRRHESMRRSSLGPLAKTRQSNSKIDLLKSALEINHGRLRHNSERDSSNHKLYKSASLIQPDKEDSIPNEKDEIVYDEIKRKAQKEQQKSAEKLEKKLTSSENVTASETLYEEIKTRSEDVPKAVP